VLVQFPVTGSQFPVRPGWIPDPGSREHGTKEKGEGTPVPYPLSITMLQSLPMNERKQINFTIVPDDSADVPRTYANFCAISHTPFDFTLSFCEVLPLSEKDIQAAESQHVVRAPIRAKVVVPLQVVPNLISALQEHMRVYSESTGATWDAKGPVH
jgi:hypothetical protein